MRGKGYIFVPIDVVTRITPAYAGKSIYNSKPLYSIWDHPRLCGEKYLQVASDYWLQGSPPPMRGKEPVQRRALSGFRITPAYAGKRSRRRFPCPKYQDHPRLCGEKLPCFGVRQWNMGSPPPMRGKGNRHEIANALNGITPAYAGKRASGFSLNLYIQDHPRLCGEKQVLKLDKLEFGGITPAYAGKSLCSYGIHNRG